MKKYIIIFMMLFITSCGEWIDCSVPKTYISSVYYHDHGRYSIGIQYADGLFVIKELFDYSIPIEVKLISDVKDNESMWYICDIELNDFSGNVKGDGCYIHIRSLDSINTAGWNHGKFGSGETIRIQ